VFIYIWYNYCMNKRKKSKRGFAVIDPERQRAIASNGGKKAQANGTAYKFTSDSARRAGLASGQARAKRKRTTTRRSLQAAAKGA
jgi:general stress protein YciG